MSILSLSFYSFPTSQLRTVDISCYADGLFTCDSWESQLGQMKKFIKKITYSLRLKFKEKEK